VYATSSAVQVAYFLPSRRKTIVTLNLPAILRLPFRSPLMSHL